MVMNIDNLIEWLIIEIELSEVQLGLKWYVKLHDTKFIILLHPFWNRKIQSDKYRIF